ncbi:STAS domain-containing protein [Sciscionella marina]|uniref:STAS domain-containing protein n=1 Tax=Sciscionella marina TaxID=508770 RepID=UPI000A06EEB8|nr:STAS domain-containing protein [Sciscionella marina]
MSDLSASYSADQMLLPRKKTHSRQQRLRAVRQRPSSGVAVCTVIGDIDLQTEPVLCDELESVARDNLLASVVVDLRAVGFLALCGVQTLVRTARQFALDQREFAVVVRTLAVRRSLEVTAAEEVLYWYENRPEAVAAAAAWARYRTAVAEVR